MAKTHPGAIHQICNHLRQKEDEQTYKMATAIIANALAFHISLARGPGKLAEVLTLDELRGSTGNINRTELLNQWAKILKVNYYPIFIIAQTILEVVPTEIAKEIIEKLATTASDLVEKNLMRSHDLTGAVFHRLIADRKFLAAFYTHPTSAALLVRLAIRSDKTPGNGVWANAQDVTSLRIADFACGTGMLLSTAYRRISQLQESAGVIQNCFTQK